MYLVSLRPSGKLDDTARTALKHLNKQFHTGRTSIFTILHMAQIMTTNCFKAFDWKNKEENQRHYNTDNPPGYKLSSVSVPVFLFWSGYDALATDKDVARLEKELTTIIGIKQLDYLHLDYLWGEDVYSGLYIDISGLLQDRAK